MEDLNGLSPAEMLKKIESLKNFTEISSIISSTLDLDELKEIVLEKAKNVMQAEACSLLLYNRRTNKLEFEIAMCREDPACETLKKYVSISLGQGIAGWVAEHQQMLVVDDVKSDSRFYQGADKVTGFETRNIIAAPLIGRRGLIGVAEILNYSRRDYDPEIFALLCRQFAIAIENSLYHRESLEQERLKQQLDIAAALQQSFLPETPSVRYGRLSLSATTLSALQVGGDLYDFIGPFGDEVGVVIGDVSGKGISAALYMAKAISDFRYCSTRGKDPGSILAEVNRMLMKYPRGMFLTATYALADTIAGTVSLASAGHPPFFLVSQGKAEPIEIPSGPPLGVMDADFPVSTISLAAGDRLILITDGVYDAKDRAGRRLGFKNTRELIARSGQERDLIGAIVDAVENFGTGAGRADDLTVVEIGWDLPA